MQTQCPHCHEWSESDGVVCPLCGASLTSKMRHEPRKASKPFYQTRRFWGILVVCVCLIGIVVYNLYEPDETQMYQARLRENIAKLKKADTWDNNFKSKVESIHTDCLWYYEDLPLAISEGFKNAQIAKILLQKHLDGKCTKGKKDNLLKAWHITKNSNDEQICYVDSFHPPKGTRDNEPGQFRLYVSMSGQNRGDYFIESLSDYRIGDSFDQGSLGEYFLTVDDNEVRSEVLNNLKPSFELDTYYLRKGQFLHVVFPVIKIDDAVREGYFFYIYRVFPLDGIDLCGSYAFKG